MAAWQRLKTVDFGTVTTTTSKTRTAHSRNHRLPRAKQPSFAINYHCTRRRSGRAAANAAREGIKCKKVEKTKPHSGAQPATEGHNKAAQTPPRPNKPPLGTQGRQATKGS